MFIFNAIYINSCIEIKCLFLLAFEHNKMYNTHTLGGGGVARVLNTKRRLFVADCFVVDTLVDVYFYTQMCRERSNNNESKV